MTGVALSFTVLLYKFVAVLAVVGVYLWAGRLRIEDTLPIRCFLSLAAGISVAYVFLHILPELDVLQEHFIAASESRVPDFILHIKIYIWALLGLVIFYGLQLAAMRNSSRDDGAPPGVFLVHIALYALYSAIIGLMIIDEHIIGLTSLVLISTALAMHFLVIDHSLRREYKQMYDSIGRWILSIAVLSGWGLGMVISLSDLAFARLFSFVAGGIIVNTFLEEIPSDHHGSFWSFALGVFLYTVLLIAIYSMKSDVPIFIDHSM